MKLPKLRMLLAAMVMLSPAARAQTVVFNNGAPVGGGAFISNTYQAADNFSLSQATALTRFNWWSSECCEIGASSVASYTVRIWTNAASLPGSILATYSVVADTGTYYGSNDGEIFSRSVDLGGIALGTGTYWMAVSDFVDANPNGAYWSQSGYDPNANLGAFRYTDSSPWQADNVDLAYNLEGTVTPEPASLVLMVTGLVGIGAAARRRRRGQGLTQARYATA